MLELAQIFEKSPQIFNNVLELARKTQKEALLQDIFDETQAQDMSVALFRKLVESANAGIVIEMNINGTPVTIRKEDYADDLAKKRYDRVVKEMGFNSSPSGEYSPREIR